MGEHAARSLTLSEGGIMKITLYDGDALLINLGL